MKGEENKLRALIEQQRNEQEPQGNALTSGKLNDMARKRTRYLEEKSEKEDKSHGLQSEKAAETKQQVEKEGQDDEKKDCTKEPLKNGEAQVVVKQEPTDKCPENENVTLSCNAMYEMVQKREIYLREEEARKKRNQEEAHDLWEKAVVAWEKEKEQMKRDIQAARAYNKEAKENYQILSIRARLNLTGH